jgi:hypothetical protein
LRKKWVLLVGAAVILLACAGSAVLVLFRPESPQAKLARVQRGMSPAEVEAVFGRPADSTDRFDHPTSDGAHQTQDVRYWHEGRWRIGVTFDANDRVQNKALDQSLDEPPSITDRLKWLLGL